MTKHVNHGKIAELLRSGSPHWITIDQSLTRGGVAGRAARWSDHERCPAAFRDHGFHFRSRRGTTDRGRTDLYILEGRYIGSGPAPY